MDYERELEQWRKDFYPHIEIIHLVPKQIPPTVEYFKNGAYVRAYPPEFYFVFLESPGDTEQTILQRMKDAELPLLDGFERAVGAWSPWYLTSRGQPVREPVETPHKLQWRWSWLRSLSDKDGNYVSSCNTRDGKTVLRFSGPRIDVSSGSTDLRASSRH